jgi:hypothetical protein
MAKSLPTLSPRQAAGVGRTPTRQLALPVSALLVGVLLADPHRPSAIPRILNPVPELSVGEHPDYNAAPAVQ